MADNQPAAVTKLDPRPAVGLATGSGLAPDMSSGMTFQEIGQSGLRAFSGYVREEFLPELQGRQAARIYREMADTSPIVGGIIFAIESTMRKVEWRVNPVNDTPEAQEMADFVDSLREDMSHSWEDAIVEGLSMLVYGYAPQEIVYKRRNGPKPNGGAATSKYDDGRIGWRRLPLRGQDTILKWFFGDHGQILGLTQQPWVGSIVDIPIEKLLLFRPSQHKNNPEGRSVLRTAYRPYYFIKRIEEQEAIVFERLNGVPVITVPLSLMQGAANGNPQDVAALNAYKKIAVNLRIDEQMGMVLPSDTFMGANGPSNVPMYKLELVTPTSSGRGATVPDTTITRHQTNILISVLADFLQLGHGSAGRGSQALGVAKQDLFFQAIEGYLNSMASVYNRNGVPRVFNLNGLDLNLMPEMVPDLAQRIDLDVLSNFVLRLGQAGMPLFPNPDLESALLDAAGLPDVQDPDAIAMATQGALGTPGVGAPPPKDPATGEPDLAKTPFGKMLLASLARRQHRHGGNGRNGH